MNIIYKRFMYDFIYLIADQLIKKYNPCSIQTSRSGLVMCEGSSIDLCCGECKYVGPQGCMTQCLGCKLAFCSAIQKDKHKELFLKLHKLRMIRHVVSNPFYSYAFSSWRTSRESNFRLLKSGCLNGGK